MYTHSTHWATPLTSAPPTSPRTNNRTKRNTQAIKAWRVYQRTEEELTTMATVLPLVDDLHSPAMRGRCVHLYSRKCVCISACIHRCA